MTIGYSVNDTHRADLLKHCDQLVVEKGTNRNFKKFVESHKADIYVYDLVDINLQVAQLLPSLEILKKRGQVLYVISDELKPPMMTDEACTDLLYQLGKQEKKIMAERTKQGLQKAKEQGTKVGRPEISDQTIHDIRLMYFAGEQSIREIAETFDVAINTVMKYAVSEP